MKQSSGKPPETAAGSIDVPESPGRVVEVVRVRELLCVVTGMCVADIAVFRGGGFAGWAILLLAFPILLHIGSPAGRPLRSTWLFTTALVFLCARLAWLGSPLTVCCGLGLLCIFALGRADGPGTGILRLCVVCHTFGNSRPRPLLEAVPVPGTSYISQVAERPATPLRVVSV